MTKKVLSLLALVGLLAGAASTFVTQSLVVQNTSNLAVATASSLSLSGTQPAPNLSQCNASPPTGSTNKGSVCLDPYNGQPWVWSGTAWVNVGAGGGSPTNGAYGDGSTGALNLVADSGLTGDSFYSSINLNGHNLATNGYHLYVNGTVTGPGVILNDGADGGSPAPSTGGGTGGAGCNAGSTFINGGGNGGAGGNNGGGNPGTGANPCVRGLGAGGTGGGGNAGGSCLTQTPSAGDIRSEFGVWAVKGPGALGNNLQCAPGGGGGNSPNATCGGGGGGGGGGFLYAAIKHVSGAVTLSAHGGKGGDGPSTGACAGANTNGGGGGAGGVIAFISQDTAVPTENVSGGAGGAKNGTGTAGTAGANGIAINLNGN